MEHFPGLTAYEITAHLTQDIRRRHWSSLSAVRRYFAAEETLAHLNYLLNRGELIHESRCGLVSYFRQHVANAV